jgi:carboxylesterase type B
MANDLLHQNFDKVYVYVFEHTPSWVPNVAFGAFHAAEIPFVFGNQHPLVWDNTTVKFTPSEWALSYQIQDLWTSFAHSSVPKSKGVSWPVYTLLDGDFFGMVVVDCVVVCFSRVSQ